jgi:primosomal protein N'
MFVITVIPLRRGVTLDALSYFSAIAYEEGSIVTIPVRNSSALGLVTGKSEVSTAKTALRAATFSLRKLPVQHTVHMLGDAYIKTARDLSVQYASSIGSVLYSLLPPEIRNGEIAIPHTHHVPPHTEYTPQVLEAKKSDRYLAYRSLVRETFAHSGSVLIVVPSSIEADEVRTVLAHGIEDRVILLSTACTKSEIKKAFEKLEDFSKAKLIVTTPTYALIERHDITTVVIEHARSSYYKELTRPYLDYRDVLSIHARHSGRKLLFADILPRTEEEALRRSDTYATYSEAPKRIELPGALSVVDMNPKEGADTSAFSLFSPEVIGAIKETHKKKGRMFLFAARRGLAPLVACMDCGYIFRSKESGAPYSLIRTMKDGVEERWFVCSASGERVRASGTCDACGSWRLRERGIGIQQVYDELHKQFPKIPVILFDHITAKTYKKALFLRDTFYGTKGVILLGTHMTLPYLTEPVDLSVVVNMDALLATPTWRLEEENLALLLRLREVTNGDVFAQTRAPEVATLTLARHGYVENFYTEELALRKSFSYPPFATFIHLTWQGAPEVVKKIETDVTTLLKDYPLSVYQNPTSTKESPIMYGLIRVPAHEWPNEKLGRLLRALPPSIRIVINPDRIV